MFRVDTEVQPTVGVEEAARILGKSSMTVRRMIKKGELEAELVSGRNGKEWQITLANLPSGLARTNEQSPARITQRNGTRPGAWDTRVGTIELAISSCGRTATSRTGSSHASVPNKHRLRWSPRRMSTG